MARARLEATVGLRTSGFQRGMNRLRRSLARFRARVRGAVGQMRIMGRIGARVGVAIAAGLAFAVREGSRFRNSMAQVNVMMGLTQSELAATSEEVTKLAAKLGIGKASLAEALFQVASAFPGIQQSDALKFLEEGAKAAVGGATDAKTAIEALVRLTLAYKLTSADAARVSDILFTTVKQGVTTIEELSGSIGRVAGIAAQAGISMQDLMAAVATVSGVVKTEEAITGLRAGINALLKPSAELTKELKDIGETGESLLKSKGLIGAFTKIMSLADGSTEKLGKLIPNIRAIPAFLELAADGAARGKINLEAMTHAAGNAAAAFKEMDKVRGWPRLWQTIMGLVSRFGVVVDKTVMPSIEKLSAKLREIAQSPAFIKFLERVKKTAELVTKSIEGIFSGGEASAQVLEGMGKVIKGFFELAAISAVEILSAGLDAASKRFGNELRSILSDIADIFLPEFLDPVKQLPSIESIGKAEVSKKDAAKARVSAGVQQIMSATRSTEAQPQPGTVVSFGSDLKKDGEPIFGGGGGGGGAAAASEARKFSELRAIGANIIGGGPNKGVQVQEKQLTEMQRINKTLQETLSVVRERQKTLF